MKPSPVNFQRNYLPNGTIDSALGQVWAPLDLGNERVPSQNLSISLNRAPLQVPLLKPAGPELVGPEYGHTDAVTGLVITDRGLAMSAGFDRALCVFSITKPRETLRKVERAHAHGITAVAHDAVNNWFITGGFDGSVKVWSADGKPVAQFDGVAEESARVAYIPLTHSYWVISPCGNLHAYDARALCDVTESTEESNDLLGRDVVQLFVLSSSESVFASTGDRGLIQYRCASGEHHSVIHSRHALLSSLCRPRSFDSTISTCEGTACIMCLICSFFVSVVAHFHPTVRC
jgi:WD40 repeat protein